KINFGMSEDNVRMQIQRPWVVIGTDAGGYDPDSTKRVVHPRSYGTYPRILGRYVREEKLLAVRRSAARERISETRRRMARLQIGVRAPRWTARAGKGLADAAMIEMLGHGSARRGFRRRRGE